MARPFFTLAMWAALVANSGTSTAQSPPPGKPSATIRVDVADKGHEIPDSLYGLFLEDINHGVDGGLYAELVQNRSFEEGVLPTGTRLDQKDDGTTRLEPARLPTGVPPDRVDMPWPWRDNGILAPRA